MPPPTNPALAALYLAAKRRATLRKQLAGARAFAEVMQAAADGRQRDRADRERAGQFGAVRRDQ